MAILAACVPFGPQASQEVGQESSSEGSALILGEEIVLGLLLVAVIVSLVSQRLRIPYTVGLMTVGLILTFFGEFPYLTLAPKLILTILVPPLVFEAAFHINMEELRRELGLLLLLTIPGVVLTTFMVGGVVSLGAGIPLSAALVFGALIAATDPVAVVALFRAIGVPRRLQILIEAESLLNDGTAIVLFNLMLTIALTGQFNLASSLLTFTIIAGGGILTGFVMGVVVSRLTSRINDHLIETALTTVVAYGAYVVAEAVLHVSGVLAVVTAGLLMGNIGPRGMSPTTRIVVFNFWEFAAFLANSFVFLLIGLQVKVQLMLDNIQAIVVAIVGVLVARAVSVYILSLTDRTLPMKWRHVLFWGGLRGAISLALALSLTSTLPYRSQLQAMAFGIVLFTIFVEGLTMKPLVQTLGLVETQVSKQSYERLHAKAIALQASHNRLQQLSSSGLLSEYSWRTLQPLIEEQIEGYNETARGILQENPGLRQEELNDAWREALRAQRSMLSSLFHDNIITEEVYNELVSEVDYAISNPDESWEELSANSMLRSNLPD